MRVAVRVDDVEVSSGDVTGRSQLVLVRVQPALDDVITHYRCRRRTCRSDADILSK